MSTVSTTSSTTGTTSTTIGTSTTTSGSTSTTTGTSTTTSGATSTTTGTSTTGNSTTGTGIIQVTTIAGALDGGCGETDGYRSDGGATFCNPIGVFLKPDGHLLVTDNGAARVRDVAPDGYVSTLPSSGLQGPFRVLFVAPDQVMVTDQNEKVMELSGGQTFVVAGSGSPSYADGFGPDGGASFWSPAGLARDGSGNLFVSDCVDNHLRKIDPSGNVTTVAGDGQAGYVDGPSSQAEFDCPTGLAFDAHGNLLVADSNNNVIRKLDPSGNVTTFAGSIEGFLDGPARSAKFSAPLDIAVDALGEVVVADRNNNRIRLIDASGNVSTLGGNGGQGLVDGEGSPVWSAEFFLPRGVAFDGPNRIYVADSNNDAIRLITR